MNCPSDTLSNLTVAGGDPLIWGQRTYVMGIINLTPDSFSGDGLGADISAVLDQALRFEAEGADFLDLGAESTRPGSTPISAEEELNRLLPALEAVAQRVKIPISVDSYKSSVAERAVDAGASIINDVWGLKRDPDLAAVAAETGSALILMHNQEHRRYRDLLPDIFGSLSHSIGQAKAAGVPEGNIILDPGIGFGKTAEHNLEVLRRLGEFKELGFPLMVGVSRKSTIRLVLDGPASPQTQATIQREAGLQESESSQKGSPAGKLLQGTAATVALAVASGADIVRVHDVWEMAQVCRMSDAVIRGWRPDGWAQK